MADVPSEIAVPLTPKRWIQFRLETLLIIMAALCLVLAALVPPVHRAYRQSRAAAVVERHGGELAYVFENDGRDAPFGSAWLRSLSGDDRLFAQVAGVEWKTPQVTDEMLSCLREFPELRRLGLLNSDVATTGVEWLQHPERLEALILPGTGISDASLAPLERAIGLKELNVRFTSVGDAGLAHIGQLAALETLILRDTQVTDVGMVHLKDLTNLVLLDLGNTDVTVAGLEVLENLSGLRWLNLTGLRLHDDDLARLPRWPQLETLYLSHTRITDSGVAQLTRFDTLGNSTSLAHR